MTATYLSNPAEYSQGGGAIASMSASCYRGTTEDDMAAPARAFSGNMQAGEFLKFLKNRPKEERWQLIEGGPS